MGRDSIARPWKPSQAAMGVNVGKKGSPSRMCILCPRGSFYTPVDPVCFPTAQFFCLLPH